MLPCRMAEVSLTFGVRFKEVMNPPGSRAPKFNPPCH